jgi:hypothetical protein
MEDKLVRLNNFYRAFDCSLHYTVFSVNIEVHQLRLDKLHRFNNIFNVMYGPFNCFVNSNFLCCG